MAENCSHQCTSCTENCSHRQDMPAKLNPHPRARVKHVIGVTSGKGGVGKSFITSLLACEVARRGFACGILDGDITGPSIPQLFGVHTRAESDGAGIFPLKSKQGIQLMSLNVLLEKETDPVIWRGSLITSAVQQFWTDVYWDVDFLFVDMPPGTGDVTLTVFQSLPLEGIVVVSSPQQLVKLIVGKAVKMAQKMNIPLLGLVENMSFLSCPHCGKRIALYGESRAAEIASQFGFSTSLCLPLDPQATQLADNGKIEEYSSLLLKPLADKLVALN